MKKNVQYKSNFINIGKSILLILIGSLLGFLFSLTGLSIGWMIGTMTLLGSLSILRPSWIKFLLPTGGFSPYWKNGAQMVLAIQIGKEMTAQLWGIFSQSWFIITGMLILSIILSILSGIFLNRYSHVGTVTSLYATAPGGLNNMPAIAEEVGANTVVVTIVQASRILLVVGLIPIFVRVEGHNNHSTTFVSGPTSWTNSSVWWTIALLISAQVGYIVLKKLKFPAARMIGGIMGVALCELIATFITHKELVPWYPGFIKIMIQIILGTSLGLSIKRDLFKGLGKVTWLGVLSSFALLLSMVFFSYLLSAHSNIPYLTAILAFAPGGVAEMTVTAMSMQENVPFVASAQTLRIIMTFLIIPPLCRFLSTHHHRNSRKRLTNSKNQSN